MLGRLMKGFLDRALMFRGAEYFRSGATRMEKLESSLACVCIYFRPLPRKATRTC